MAKWHPAKIVVIWIAALISYLFFRDVVGLDRDYARGAWFFALAIALIITWIWLSKREKGGGP